MSLEAVKAEIRERLEAEANRCMQSAKTFANAKKYVVFDDMTTLAGCALILGMQENSFRVLLTRPDIRAKLAPVKTREYGAGQLRFSIEKLAMFHLERIEKSKF